MQLLKSVTWKTTSTDKKLLTLELPATPSDKPLLIKVDAFAVGLEDLEDFAEAITEARILLLALLPQAKPAGGAS